MIGEIESIVPKKEKWFRRCHVNDVNSFLRMI